MEESNNNESFVAGEDTERLVPDRSSSDVPQPPHNTSADELGAGPDASGNGRCCLWELCCGEETPQCRARLKGVGIAVSILSLIGFIVSAVMVAGAYESILHNLLQTELEVVPGSKSYDIWKATPVPLTLSFYFFNLTNPIDFQNGHKPVLKEVGPYVYQEFHEKTNISFHANATVSYFQRRWWRWDERASGNRTRDDVFCIVNSVPVSAAYAVSRHPVILSSLNMMFNKLGEKLILYKPVKEIIFDGYKDPLLDFVHNVTSKFANISDDSEARFKSQIKWLPPALRKYDRMGWFYKRNMSTVHDGHFTMHTGSDSLEKLGRIDRWNGTQATGFYPSPCNKVFGSAGELWPPKQDGPDISLYSPDLCITLTLPYKEKMEKFGVQGSRFWGSNDTFASPRYNPKNLCQCYERKLSNCPPSGLLDAQTCNMGAPAFVSFPHFLHGDPQLLKGVEGVSAPNVSLHQFHIDLVPELGVPLEVNARVQLNMKVVPYRGTVLGIGKIDMFASMTEVMLPVLWFELTASVTEEMAGAVRSVVRVLGFDMRALLSVALVVLPVVLLFSLFVCVQGRRPN